MTKRILRIFMAFCVSASFCISAQALTIKVVPAKVQAQNSSRLALEVLVEGVDVKTGGLSGYELRLRYDPALVSVASSDDAKVGSFLRRSPRPSQPLPARINNKKGIIRLGAFSLGSGRGASGDGVLFTVIFTIDPKATGVFEIKPTNIMLIGSGLKVVKPDKVFIYSHTSETSKSSNSSL